MRDSLPRSSALRPEARGRSYKRGSSAWKGNRRETIKNATAAYLNSEYYQLLPSSADRGETNDNVNHRAGSMTAKGRREKLSQGGPFPGVGFSLRQKSLKGEPAGRVHQERRVWQRGSTETIEFLLDLPPAGGRRVEPKNKESRRKARRTHRPSAVRFLPSPRRRRESGLGDGIDKTVSLKG